MSGPNLTFVIVPGACQPSPVYQPLVDQLKESGYSSEAVTLPSLNAQNPASATCQADADAIRQRLSSLIEHEGKDVVLVNHSYGGIPGGGAAYRLGKDLRATQGKNGGVVGIVYLTAFVVPEGTSLLEYLGQHPPYIKQNHPTVGLCVIEPVIETLYADVEPNVARDLEASLLPHAMKAFESPAPSPAWKEPEFAGKVAFLRCTQDQALPTFVQDMFTQRSGVDWVVKDLEASHSPFLSKTKEVVEILKEFLAVFEKK